MGLEVSWIEPAGMRAPGCSSVHSRAVVFSGQARGNCGSDVDSAEYLADAHAAWAPSFAFRGFISRTHGQRIAMCIV